MRLTDLQSERLVSGYPRFQRFVITKDGGRVVAVPPGDFSHGEYAQRVGLAPDSYLEGTIADGKVNIRRMPDDRPEGFYVARLQDFAGETPRIWEKVPPEGFSYYFIARPDGESFLFSGMNPSRIAIESNWAPGSYRAGFLFGSVLFIETRAGEPGVEWWMQRIRENVGREFLATYIHQHKGNQGIFSQFFPCDHSGPGCCADPVHAAADVPYFHCCGFEGQDVCKFFNPRFSCNAEIFRFDQARSEIRMPQLPLCRAAELRCDVPFEFQPLPACERLELHCPYVKQLHPLPKLKYLDVSGSRALSVLPELPAIEEIRGLQDTKVNRSRLSAHVRAAIRS
jgi:hypothetical protein